MSVFQDTSRDHKKEVYTNIFTLHTQIGTYDRKTMHLYYAAVLPAVGRIILLFGFQSNHGYSSSQFGVHTD